MAKLRRRKGTLGLLIKILFSKKKLRALVSSP